jgi:hypothetical protein
MTDAKDPNVRPLKNDQKPEVNIEPAWDLTARETPQPVSPAHTEPYSPDRNREIVRSIIAGGLLLLIALLSGSAVVLYLLGRSLDDIAKLYGLVVTPVITLTSGIIGFYFAAEARRSR